MPVDPPIARILNFLREAGAPSMADGTVAQARHGFRTPTVELRDPATLAQVRSTEDIKVPGELGPRQARVYRPDVDGPVPTMAFFHGGGFVVGDVDTHEDHARLICRDAQMVVVSIDYRLAPEDPFPAGFNDCLAATRWVAEHADELGGDPARVVVGGDSAGGNLAAAVALATREAGPELAAQLLLYPSLHLDDTAEYASRVENAEGYFLTAADMRWFHGHYIRPGTDTDDPRLSPLRAASLEGAPPAVIGVAEYDPLRDEGEAYAKRLADAGVEVRFHRYDGMIHGFVGFSVYSDAAKAAGAELLADLRDLVS
jgi:acetyl esterase